MLLSREECVGTIIVFLSIFNKSLAKEYSLNYYCHSDTDCKNNSFCSGIDDQNKIGTCDCNNGFFYFANRTFYDCFEVINTIGANCLVDAQCQYTLGFNEAECDSENICQCKPNAHFEPKSNSCVKTSKLNEICKVHENCVSPNDEPVFCTNGKCTCGLNQHVATNGSCIRSIDLDQPCESDESCMHASAVCKNVCTCRDGYVVAKYKQTCVKEEDKKYHEETCSEDRECVSLKYHVHCINGICIASSSIRLSAQIIIATILLFITIIIK